MTTDASVRVKALDTSQSFICEAPAGSGKTELLTQRVLSLLAQVELPESVLAITFTRKAAAEMRERVLNALLSALQVMPEEAHKQATWTLAKKVLERDKKFGWLLLDNPLRLNIRTFDGLSKMLVQALPLKAEFDARWPPAEDSYPLYEAAAKDLLKTLEQQVPWQRALCVLLEHLDNQQDKLIQLIASMLQKRDGWLPVMGAGMSSTDDQQRLKNQLEQFIEIAIADHIQTLCELIPQALIQPLLKHADFAGYHSVRLSTGVLIQPLKGISQSGLPGSTADDSKRWLGLSHLLLTGDGKSWRKRADKNIGFPAEGDKNEKAIFTEAKKDFLALIGLLQNIPQLLDELKAIRYWPTHQFSATQWPVLEALTQVLPVAVVHLHWVFQRKNVLDFTEISQQARMVLGDEEAPTDLALKLDYKIQHILVDEFQDTSFSQIDLLTRLTRGWQVGDGRTLFCVGDAMQSIYSFREANVGLFLNCKGNGLGGIPLTPIQLTANFRSRPEVVHWFNHTFKSAFPPYVDISCGAVPLSEAEPARNNEPTAGVQAQLFDQPSDDCGKWLVQQLHALWGDSPGATVGILVRSRSHARPVVLAMNQAGILFRAVDMVPLIQSTPVADVHQLTLALLNRANRIAWLALLRAPWCGLTLKELTALHSITPNEHSVLNQMADSLAHANKGKLESLDLFDDLTTLSQPIRKRIQNLYMVLKNAIDARERKLLSQWVEGAWRALGGRELLRSEEEVLNVERYFSMLEDFDQRGIIPTEEALEIALSKLYSAPNPEATEQVQIMTMHKSKGLEFDAVFLPELSAGASADSAELLLWHERLSHGGEDTLLIAPISAVGADKDAMYKYLEFEKSKRQRLEACRLLYVACTRAREKLFLMARVSRNEKTQALKAPRSDSLLYYIWPSVKLTAQVGMVEKEQLTPPQRAACVIDSDEGTAIKNWLFRVPDQWQPQVGAEASMLEPYVAHHQYENDNLQALTEWNPHEDVARHVGTVVHEQAQRLAYARHLPRHGDLEAMLPVFRARLVSLGVPQVNLSAALTQTRQLTEKLVRHPKFEWICAQPERHCEYAVTYKNGQNIARYVLDVFVKTTNDVGWVVDYKTSEPGDGETHETFIAKETEIYRPILSQYRRAMVALGHSNVATALFFVAIGRWYVVHEPAKGLP